MTRALQFTPFQKPGGGTLSVTEHKWAESLVSNIGKHGIAPLTQYIQYIQYNTQCPPNCDPQQVSQGPQQPNTNVCSSGRGC